MSAGLIPDITLLSCHRVYPYEWPSREAGRFPVQRTPYDVIRHPFPVMHLEQDRYLLLDGSEMFRQMVDMGIQHLPVQICDCEHLRVLDEPLGLVGFGLEDLTEIVAGFPDQMAVCDDGSSPPVGTLELQFSFEKAGSKRVFLRQTNCTGCPEALQHVFHAIERKGRYMPVRCETLWTGVVYKAAPLTGTVTLPSFSLDDVATAVASGRLYPPHVLRVQPASRVLSIDFPLSVLRSNTSIEEKGLFLRDLIAYRESSHRITYFTGHVYLLNR
ncbi:MAG TPA: hypothetical protein VMY05_08855 [Acidobacteriota bacterium]|nr:hypothetical protein [Acidobacteriota bacterium]